MSMLTRRFFSVAALTGALVAAAPMAHAAVTVLTPADYAEIQQLYATYAHCLDKGLGPQFADTFTEDGEFTGGRGPGKAAEARTPRKGRAALTVMGSTSGTRHMVTNIMITPTEEGAKGSAYLLLYSARTIPSTLVETAIYDDVLVRTPKGWKFKKRVVWRDDDDITPFKPKPLPAGRQ
jgi:3-phenylpropionate/cinnamic acid dioxygenase small subunit